MDGSRVTAAVTPTRYAALFVDVPNVEHKNTIDENRPLSLEEMDWSVLFSLMLQTLGSHNRVLYMGAAYDFVRNGRTKTRSLVHRSLRQSFGPDYKNVSVTVALKDIDSTIVNDIWHHTLKMVTEQQVRGKAPPYDVTILLAGGDGVYARPIKCIRELFGSEVRLSLHTFSWERSLSRELLNTSERVLYLDNLPRFHRQQLRRA